MSFCGETFAVFHFQVWWNFHAVVACNVVNHFQPVEEVFLVERLASEIKTNRIKDFLDPSSWLSRIFLVLLFEACHRWRGRAPNVSWTPILPPLNTETQRIELTCFYRKLSLKSIYNSDGERDRLLISGTTTVGTNNNHTATAPQATTRATIDSFVGKHINGNRSCFAVQSNQDIGYSNR